MRKLKIVVGVMSLLLLLQFTLVAPVSGITNGQPDEGNQYPYVGVLKVDHGDGVVFHRCSGILISPTHFLMDGWCIWWVYFHPTWKGYISLDPQIFDDDTLNNWTPVVNFVHQGLGGNEGNGGGNYHDLVVVELPPGFADGHQPATLTTPGLLNNLAVQDGLRGMEFTTVGYGAQVDWEQGPARGWWDGWRNYASAPFQALTQDSVHINMNEHVTGGGGICFGDSTAPLILPRNDEDIVVGIASRCDTQCRALGVYYRLDTPWAQEFLSQFVELP